MTNYRQALNVAQKVVFGIIVILITVACGGPELPSQIEVIETEWAVDHQVSSVKAGQVTFVVKNEGALEHNFVIEGIDQKIELILPQESETLEVTLGPGIYRILCNLPGHQEAGMVSEISVK